MRQGTFDQYINYFEEIANRHPQIKHFLAIDQEDLDAKELRVNGKYPVMLAEYPDLPLVDNKSNTVFNPISGIVILKPVRKGYPEEKKQALIEAEKILLDIVSFLREDRRTGTLYIDTNDIQLQKVGPIYSDNCYGWRMELKYQHWVDLDFYPEEWNDYDPNKFLDE